MPSDDVLARSSVAFRDGRIQLNEGASAPRLHHRPEAESPSRPVQSIRAREAWSIDRSVGRANQPTSPGPLFSLAKSHFHSNAGRASEYYEQAHGRRRRPLLKTQRKAEKGPGQCSHNMQGGRGGRQGLTGGPALDV